MLPAAAIGPGVGGTKLCVANKPVARATASEATATLARLAKAFFKEDKIIYPESQKTGILTIAPIILIANCGLFSPTMRRTNSAIRKAAPERSNITPIIVPQIDRKSVV